MELSDSELIHACIRKDKKAWDLFVESFSKLIYWNIRKVFAAYAFVNREELVQEVFQQVFERLIEKEELKKLQNSQSLRKFISVMAAHAALDRAKALGRFEKRVVSGEIPEATTAETPASVASANETTELIESVLNELSVRERTCVEFYYFNELTSREIGNILDITEDAVSAVVRRAKEKIRAGLTERGF